MFITAPVWLLHTVLILYPRKKNHWRWSEEPSSRTKLYWGKEEEEKRIQGEEKKRRKANHHHTFTRNINMTVIIWVLRLNHIP